MKLKRSVIIAYIIFGVVGVGIIVTAFLLECLKLLDGKFLSEFFGEYLRAHDAKDKNGFVDGQVNFYYFLYYAIFYMGLIGYIILELLIFWKGFNAEANKNVNMAWFVLGILITIFTLFAANGWLTISFEYDKNALLYSGHMVCVVCIATILSGVLKKRFF